MKKKTARVRKPARKLVNPKAVVSEKVYDRALAAVNRIREAAGHTALYDLPSGTPGEPKYCPLALALADVGVTEVNAGEGVRLDGRT